MTNPLQTHETRSYRFLEIEFRVTGSATITEALDSRFRLFPADLFHAEGLAAATISADFQSVPDASQHVVERPEGKGRSFYEFPAGEVTYFQDEDEIYLNFNDSVRALAKPALNSLSFSLVESDPVNVFMASHLMLTILLVEIMKRRDCYSMHAAGFSSDGKAILIPGTSGAGKSTLAITLLRGGLGYLSDDMVFLRRADAGLEVLGFPEDVDVNDQTIAFFPELDFLKGSTKNAGWSKKQVRADEVYRSELVRQASPRAIVFPQISRNATSIVRPLTADEAFREIVSNVLLTDAVSCRNHLAILTQLVKQTPCFRLETGRDFDRIPALLRALLTGSREQVHA